MPNRQYWFPAILIWGGVFGLVGIVPIVNCCGCIFTLVAGMLAVRAVTNAAPTQTLYGEGAVIGILTGLLSGGMHGVFNAITQLVLSENLANWYRQAGMPPQVVAQAEAAASNPMGTALSALCAGLILGPAFGAVGGLLGAAIFKKQ